MSFGHSLPAVHKLPTTVIGWDPHWTLRCITHCPRREWSHIFNYIFFLVFQACIFEALLNEHYLVSSDPHSTMQLSHYSKISTTYTNGWLVLRSVFTKVHGVIICNIVIFIFKLRFKFCAEPDQSKRPAWKIKCIFSNFVSLPWRPMESGTQ